MLPLGMRVMTADVTTASAAGAPLGTAGVLAGLGAATTATLLTATGVAGVTLRAGILGDEDSSTGTATVEEATAAAAVAATGDALVAVGAGDGAATGVIAAGATLGETYSKSALSDAVAAVSPDGSAATDSSE